MTHTTGPSGWETCVGRREPWAHSLICEDQAQNQPAEATIPGLLQSNASRARQVTRVESRRVVRQEGMEEPAAMAREYTLSNAMPCISFFFLKIRYSQ